MEVKETLINAYYAANEGCQALPRHNVEAAADIVLKAISPNVISYMSADRVTLFLSTVGALVTKGVPIVIIEAAVYNSLATDLPLLLPKTALGLEAMCSTLLSRIADPVKDNVVKFPRRPH